MLFTQDSNKRRFSQKIKGKKKRKEKDLLCKVLTLFTTLGCGMLHVCKMRLWERLADSISGVAGLMPSSKR